MKECKCETCFRTTNEYKIINGRVSCWLCSRVCIVCNNNYSASTEYKVKICDECYNDATKERE